MANRNTARLLKPTSSTQSMASALSLQPAQLTSASVTHAVEEDLESQARASLSLFGFGAKDSVNWSPVSASAAAAAASATENPGTGGAIKVRVMERVCPIGTNTFLWNTMNSLVNGGEGGDDPAASGADPAAANGNGSNGVNGASAWENDASDWDSASSAAGLGNVFASKVLQQYLVKCVALLPSSLEEVVDLLVRSDREDMELPMQHLVGVRTSSSAFVYHRKKKRLRRGNNNTTGGNANNGIPQRMASQTTTLDCDSESSYSDSDLESEEDVQPFTGFSRESTAGRSRGARGDSLEADRSINGLTSTIRGTNSGPYLSPTYMEDYRAAMATSGHQGNLSIKWVVGEKSSRMFASRTTYCLLDYECFLVNDWDDSADPSPMYVRTLQSCYSPHCQPWLDEVGSKPTDLQPTGFMVREARGRDGYVEQNHTIRDAITSIPRLREYYLGSYVTKALDEVRDEIAARQLSKLGVVVNSVHYFDTFDRKLLPLIDLDTKSKLTRTASGALSLTDFLVRANLRRADLLASLPGDILTLPVNLMEDLYAPLCGPVSASLSSWETPPQLLFGNWFPLIRHEFCRDLHDKFPRHRFFNHRDKAPIDAQLKHVGNVTLGLITVVNMSEVYLRHFDDALVIRKIMKSVQEGYMDLELPEYSTEVAEGIMDLYREGISLADVIALLPGSFDTDHVALVDVLGVSSLLAYYLEPQQLSVGVNVNGEAAILAEVTHATASFFTPDFLINTVGMHLVSTMHLAPFWNCAIQHTTMKKSIAVADVDEAAMQQCGSDMAFIIPAFAVNLMFLFQKDERDYSKLDNITTYTLGRRRESADDYVALEIPEILDDSVLFSMDGSKWKKSRDGVDTTSPTPPTPYGYLYTPDCREIVDFVMQQSGRNVQKYQAYLGDGLGNCGFRDSQETELQSLCRLFMTSKEVLFRALNGSLIDLPTCASLIVADSSIEIRALEQSNLRQIEWYMTDSTMLTRRIRIQDNTSRQIRTFLLILNLIGASHYAIEYIVILKSVWVFIRNSVYRPAAEAHSQSRVGSLDLFKNAAPLVKIGIFELLQCDPADGALGHPGTMVLLYLGAIGSLSNIFLLSCTAQLSTREDSIVIYCAPAIPMRSLTLVLTTLSSSYWVIRVTLQTRSLAIRLDHAARNDFVRFWSLNAVAVLVIHFSCKAGADLFFRDAELHSDPHLISTCAPCVFRRVEATYYAATTINESIVA
ncbi:hypothetical protein KRP22_011467 [Phytophthora ramorum]|nr:hypothetical protein KRP22_10670 [Phytophthora ramorum]